MARVKIPDAHRISDIKGHIEEVTARLAEEAAEQAEKEKQMQALGRSAQQKGMPAAMTQAEEEEGSSGTDVLDLTDPDGYFARLQRAQENETRKAEPAAGEKTQQAVSGLTGPAKGKQYGKAAGPAARPNASEKGSSEKSATVTQEVKDSQEAHREERAPAGPVDAPKKNTEKAVKLRTDPKERAKDLTNASKEDAGQRVSGAVIKARIAREKAMATAQVLFSSFGGPLVPNEGKGGEKAVDGKTVPESEKPVPRVEKDQPARTGMGNAPAPKTAEEHARTSAKAKASIPAMPQDKTGPVSEKAPSRPVPAQNGGERHATTERGNGLAEMLQDGKTIHIGIPAQIDSGKRVMPDPGSSMGEPAVEQEKVHVGKDVSRKASEIMLAGNTAAAGKGRAPSTEGNAKPSRGTGSMEDPQKGRHSRADEKATAATRQDMARTAAAGAERQPAAKEMTSASAVEKQARPAHDMPVNSLAAASFAGREPAPRQGTDQANKTGRATAVVNTREEDSRGTAAKHHRREMGVTSQGKTFERFDLDKALTNAYDTSKAYGTVMEMATFTHTNGRPVAVTHNGDTLRFDKDKEGNTFAYINGTRVEPLEAARFLVRYDRATLGGAAVLVARLQLALRDPFQKGLSAPAKAPLPGKGKETEKGKGMEGKTEKPSRGGREAGTGR